MRACEEYFENLNAGVMVFKYEFYRTCDNINVIHFASQNVTSPSKKNDMVVKRTPTLQGKTMFWLPMNTNFDVKNIRLRVTRFKLFFCIYLDSYISYFFIYLDCYINYLCDNYLCDKI